MRYIDKLNGSLRSCRAELDSEYKTIRFTGTSSEDLEAAKSQVINTLRTIVGAEIECADKKKAVDNWNSDRKHYLRKIKEENLSCVVDARIVENSLFIYSTSHEHIKNFEQILNNK